ncbi:pyridoxamine 5'-phosphate oxidase [Anaerophaga thermohalophila]|uniref:pyridoxamine 5'-phosphate oxidase n=1 Tax=Anaerophaga thermohalophila TaxID=177400 RepID=UPI0002E8DDD5|nr:pyridoxamine 5'-phosphate oxidase [Anaerophaga thermohalophila]
MKSKFSDIRNDYKRHALTRDHLEPLPLLQLRKWLDEAMETGQTEPTAMSLASVDVTGQPSQRVVLMKGITDRGITFFTNYLSRKGAHFQENPRASAVFFWPSQERQVRLEGLVEKLPAHESDEYFNSRPRESQIGAWASPQSERVTSREMLENLFEELILKFKNKKVPRPPHWGGYLLVPHRVEFWQGRPNRMHDRFEYLLNSNNDWDISRLAP